MYLLCTVMRKYLWKVWKLYLICFWADFVEMCRMCYLEYVKTWKSCRKPSSINTCCSIIARDWDYAVGNISYSLKCKYEAIVIYSTTQRVKQFAECQCFVISSTGSHVQLLCNHFVLVTYESTGCSVSELHCVVNTAQKVSHVIVCSSKFVILS